MRAMNAAPILLFAALALASCSGESPQDALFAQQAAARTTDFQEALRQELTTAMLKGGPAAAIEVCSVRAPALAAENSTGGLRVRRIGTRTRNPGNASSSRDEAALKQLAEQPLGEARAITLFDHTTGTRAHYAPILTAAPCLMCHGTKESLTQEVTAALAARYPEDRATGYELGDLRGAVVVEQDAK